MGSVISWFQNLVGLEKCANVKIPSVLFMMTPTFGKTTFCSTKDRNYAAINSAISMFVLGLLGFIISKIAFLKHPVFKLVQMAMYIYSLLMFISIPIIFARSKIEES